MVASVNIEGTVSVDMARVKAPKDAVSGEVANRRRTNITVAWVRKS
jgi:hypothetical protein